MTAVTTISNHLGDVTSEQIGRCHKVYDFQTGQNFYMVENERGDFNEAGELIEYKVTYDKKGFHCTCKAGQYGFAHVHHPSGVCKHVRWAWACAREERAAMAEMAVEQAQEALEEVKKEEHVLIIGDKPADAETLDRVLNAKAKKSRAKPRTAKAFSLLR